MPKLAPVLLVCLSACLTRQTIGRFSETGTSSTSSGTGTSSGGELSTSGSATSGSGTGTTSGGGTTGTTTGTPLPPGAVCDSNQACASGVCGVTGDGHCCLSACPLTAPPCGATDCDTSGACIYPGSSVTCGAPPFCRGSILVGAGLCDGAGGCPGGADCAPFGCTDGACTTTCRSNAGCDPSAYCDKANSACCAGLASGGRLAVDSILGDDATACCGTAVAPCRTLSHAMQLIDEAKAHDVLVEVAVNGAGGDWKPAGETYPIVLGWGVELQAPGVSFLDLEGSNSALFEIAPVSANDVVGFASIVGLPGNPAMIGSDTAGDQTQDPMTLEIAAHSTLYLANADIDGAGTAIFVPSGGTLVLGQSRAAEVAGTVQIGTGSLTGLNGIVCLGGNVHDATLVGESSIVIQRRTTIDLDVESGSTVILGSTPTIGVPPAHPGFLQCPSKIDGSASGSLGAVVVASGASLTLDNGVIQCVAGNAISSAAADPDYNTLVLSHMILQNAGRCALDQWSFGGATISNATIRYNAVGILLEVSTSSVDLSGGSLGGRNTLACSNAAESTLQPAEFPGITLFDLDNQIGVVVQAQNVDWDTPGPDQFNCPDGGECVCTLSDSSCVVTPGASGMDFVGGEFFALIDATGHGVASIDCSIASDGGSQ